MTAEAKTGVQNQGFVAQQKPPDAPPSPTKKPFTWRRPAISNMFNGNNYIYAEDITEQVFAGTEVKSERKSRYEAMKGVRARVEREEGKVIVNEAGQGHLAIYRKMRPEQAAILKARQETQRSERRAIREARRANSERIKNRERRRILHSLFKAAAPGTFDPKTVANTPDFYPDLNLTDALKKMNQLIKVLRENNPEERFVVAKTRRSNIFNPGKKYSV